jgi:hypothetical protein
LITLSSNTAYTFFEDQTMKKILGYLLISLMLALWLAVPSFATTVTGTIKYASGMKLYTGTITLQLSQAGIVTTPALLVPQPPTSCPISQGVIQNCTVQGNDVISPAGTYYTITVLDQSGRVVMPAGKYTIGGSSWDIGQNSPVVSDVVASTAYQTIQDEGVPLPTRRIANFMGSSIICTDNPATGTTDCAVSGPTEITAPPNTNITFTTSGTGRTALVGGGLQFPDATVLNSATPITTPAEYWVDSISGSDANTGLSAGAAFQTLTKLRTISLGSGMTVHLKRNSLWYGVAADGARILDYSTVPNLTFTAYGGGQAPIVDGSAIAANASFTLYAGALYSISWANGLGSATPPLGLRVWENSGNGFRELVAQTSIANAQATTCSSYGVTPANPATVYVHACDDSSVITNGYTYEITVNDFGIQQGDNGVLEGIHLRFFGAGYAVSSGDYQYWKDDIFESGQTHSVFVASGTVDHCLFWKTDSAVATSQFVAYTATGAGRKLIVRDSTFIGGDPWNPDSTTLASSAFYAHTGANDQFNSITIDNCKFLNFAAGIGGAAKDWVFTNNVVKRFASAAFWPSGQAGWTTNITFANNFIDASNPTGPVGAQALRLGTSPSGKLLAYGNVIILQIPSYGAIYVDSSSTSYVVTAQNNTFIFTNHSSGATSAIDAQAGTLTFNNNVVNGANYPVNAGVAVSLTADYNIYHSRGWNDGATFTAGGSNYATFALYAAGTGQDAHGSVVDPNVQYDSRTGSTSVPRYGIASTNRAGASFADASLESQAASQLLGYNGPVALAYAPGPEAGSSAWLDFSSVAALGNITSGGDTDSVGTVTLSGGTYTLTFAGHYLTAPICTGSDRTAVNAVKILTGTTSAVFTGTTTDVIGYICVRTD